MEKLIVNINFNSQNKRIIIPHEYDLFLKKIEKLLDISSDLISELEFKYSDGDERICLGTNEEYGVLLTQLIEQDTTIFIKNKKGSKIDIDACTKSFINFTDINNHINNGENEISNDDMDSSNINMINRNNDFVSLLNNNITKKEMKKNINKDNNAIEVYISINLKKNILTSLKYLTFFETCHNCSIYPMVNILYYCFKCDIAICEKCEKNSDFNHDHPLLKIQTKNQYNDLMNKKYAKENSNHSRMKKLCNSIRYYTPFLSPRKERLPELMNRIQIAREKYDLNNLKDKEIEIALIKAFGNIDKAFDIIKNSA